MDDPTPDLDAFHWHELLHTTHVMGAIFEEHVAGHRAAQADPEIKAAAERIAADLADFYQLVGARTP